MSGLVRPIARAIPRAIGRGVVRNPVVSSEPAEFITNGAFAADSDWTKGAGWSIAAGVASNAGTTGILSQDFSALTAALIADNSYTIAFDLGGSLSGDTISCRMFDGVTPQVVVSTGATGAKSATFVASQNHTTIQFLNGDGIDAYTIDNVSLVPA